MEGKLFSLFKRGKIWYVQFKKPDNTFTTARSTKMRSRNDAERFAIEYLQKGNIVIKEKVTFAEFAGDFFSWDGSWAMDKRVRGLRLSERQCMTLTRTFNKWVIPAFGNCRLMQIDRESIKAFRNQLYNLGLAGNTINFILSTIRTVLEDAEEKGLLRGVPKIDRVAKKSKSKGILTVEEVRHLFSMEWADYRIYAASLLACTSGLRLGEILGLVVADFNPEERRIFCRRSWDHVFRRLNQTTKTGRARNIFIPQHVVDVLKKMVEMNPYAPLNAESFLFYADKSDQYPTEQKLITDGFYKALEKIGIPEEIRRQRNITFHSHRHFLNSLLINSNIPLQKIQSITGHLTMEMTQHYYHLDDMQDVQSVQEKLFNKLL